MKTSITIQRPRSRNGHRRPSGAKAVVKASVVPFLAKLLLRKSVLIAVGLGTLVSWYVKYRFFRPKVHRFRLF